MTGGALNGPGRLRRLGPFAVAVVLAVLLGPATYGDDGDVALEVLATALLVGVVLAGWLVPWERLPVWTQAVPVYLVLPAIGLLRHANGGAASGYAPLALLPVLWLALHAGRRELLVGLALLGATFLWPVVLAADSTLYPASSWRLAVLIVVTGAVIGLTTQDLTRQVSRRSPTCRRSASSLGTSPSTRRPAPRSAPPRVSWPRPPLSCCSNPTPGAAT